MSKWPARLFPRFDGVQVISRSDVAVGHYRAIAFQREEFGELRLGIPEWSTTIVLNPADYVALTEAIAADVASIPEAARG